MKVKELIDNIKLRKLLSEKEKKLESLQEELLKEKKLLMGE